MKTDAIHITARDGTQLEGKVWQPENDAIASLYIVHGLGEHIGRYNYMAHYLTSYGIMVCGFDLRGHGKSSGKRGHSDYKLLLQDLEEALKTIKRDNSQRPLFLLGHSLGGNIAATYVLKKNVNFLHGVIINSPWLMLGFNPPKIKMWLGRMMSKLYPAYTENNGLDVTKLSHDPKVAEEYINDSLVHMKISAGLFQSAYESGRWAIENANNLTIPALLMHGSEDAITSPKGSKAFAVNAGKKIDFKLWKDMFHETHHEVGKNIVLDHIKNWIRGKIEKQIHNK